MADTFDAFLAGQYVEIKIVTMEITQETRIEAGVTTRCSLSDVLNTSLMMEFRKAKVMPIPNNPERTPIGILIAPIITPSKKTEFRFCFFVAPTLESIPK